MFPPFMVLFPATGHQRDTNYAEEGGKNGGNVKEG